MPKELVHSVEKSHNKSLAIQNSQKLVDGPGGLIIMNNFNDKPHASYNNTKTQMLNEIKKSLNLKESSITANLKLKTSQLKITVIHNHIYY